ncbi:MAG: histidine phosphatase family protein [Gammaproteobacteria bacterium]|nr:histidine phosphatase family protein [Gammaproteobacteria bacterium]
MSAVRTLILLRHAAAEPAAAGHRDFDRGLDPGGHAEARAAARRLAALPFRPALLLVSPARRTQLTAEIIARHLRLGADALHAEPSLYLAPVRALRAAIARAPAAIDCLLVVGHNPALSDLASEISPPENEVLLATAEFAVRQLPQSDWTLP